jgi:hypothetical protein
MSTESYARKVEFSNGLFCMVNLTNNLEAIELAAYRVYLDCSKPMIAILDNIKYNVIQREGYWVVNQLDSTKTVLKVKCHNEHKEKTK